jgi:putative two-component system response regulator
MNQLYNSITTSSLGYSWRGRLESGGKKERKVIANTMIFPIYSQNSDDINPVGYAAVFDNITKEYRDMQRTTFSSLLEASKLKDNDTGQHIQRVNEYSQTIAKALYKNSKKIGTPDDILNKTGPLDGREWEIMKEHTINGAYILSTYANPMAKEIALFHHEHWDGNGYPYLLSEAMIPLSARIVALADVYDALRMQRSYKTSYNHEKAYSIILDSEGNHFDPQLTAVFKKNETDFADIYEKLAD